MRFHIDLFRSLPDGEVYVMLLEWEGDVLYRVRAAMGPLYYADRCTLREAPQDWDGDPDWDLEAITEQMHQNVGWAYIETLYACA